MDDEQLQQYLQKAIDEGYRDPEVLAALADDYKKKNAAVPQKLAGVGIKTVSDEDWAKLSGAEKIKAITHAAGSGIASLLGLHVDAHPDSKGEFTSTGQEAVDHPVATLASAAIPAALGAGVKSAIPAINTAATKAVEVLDNPVYGGTIGAVHGAYTGYKSGGIPGAIMGGGAEALAGVAGSSVLARKIKGSLPKVVDRPHMPTAEGYEQYMPNRPASSHRTAEAPGPMLRSADAETLAVLEPHMPNQSADSPHLGDPDASASHIPHPESVVDRYMANQSAGMPTTPVASHESLPISPDAETAALVERFMPNKSADHPAVFHAMETTPHPMSPDAEVIAMLDHHMPNKPSASHEIAPGYEAPGQVSDVFRSMPQAETAPTKTGKPAKTTGATEPAKTTEPESATTKQLREAMKTRESEGPPSRRSQSKNRSEKSANDQTVYDREYAKGIREGKAEAQATLDAEDVMYEDRHARNLEIMKKKNAGPNAFQEAKDNHAKFMAERRAHRDGAK